MERNVTENLEILPPPKEMCIFCYAQIMYDFYFSELKNKNTGIDIYVPKYDTIPGHLGGTVMYHVIVVTRLFYFKSNSKYKESDVVQFMVSTDWLKVYFVH